MWQQFYNQHKSENIEILSVAVDVQGPDKPRIYTQKANTAFTTVVDRSNLLAELFNFKAVPNCLLIGEDGVLQYRKYGGFDIRNNEYLDLLEKWVANPTQSWLAEQVQEDPTGGPEHHTAIAHFRRGQTLYETGNIPGAIAEWESGRDLEPDNWNIRKQIWAVTNPDKFYSGEVDYNWQHAQIEQGS